VQLVCIVVPRVVGDPQIFHQCNALVEHLSVSDLRKALFMLVGIISEFCDEYQTRPRVYANCDQSDLSILNLSFLVLLTTF
jgi:hypothetical protein